MLGYFFALCTLVSIVKIAIDTYQESRQAKWPSVVATITQQFVQRDLARGRRSGSRYVWRIESGLRYAVDGEAVTASLRSRVTYSAQQAAMMRRWVAQHPVGTPLPVRYDPNHHNKAVPDGGDMPESGPQVQDDLKMLLIFLVPSVVFLTIGRLQGGQGS